MWNHTCMKKAGVNDLFYWVNICGDQCGKLVNLTKVKRQLTDKCGNRDPWRELVHLTKVKDFFAISAVHGGTKC